MLPPFPHHRGGNTLERPTVLARHSSSLESACQPGPPCQRPNRKEIVSHHWRQLGEQHTANPRVLLLSTGQASTSVTTTVEHSVHDQVLRTAAGALMPGHLPPVYRTAALIIHLLNINPIPLNTRRGFGHVGHPETGVIFPSEEIAALGRSPRGLSTRRRSDPRPGKLDVRPHRVDMLSAFRHSCTPRRVLGSLRERKTKSKPYLSRRRHQTGDAGRGTEMFLHHCFGRPRTKSMIPPSKEHGVRAMRIV